MPRPSTPRSRGGKPSGEVATRLLFLAVLVTLLLPSSACRLVGSPRPSIIVVLVDTLRADYLGAYGFRGSVSPNLDLLAEESVLFRNCFAQSPWTKPAVASLFTSLYPQVHGLTNHEGKYWGEATPERTTGILADEAVTLAESLRDAGYQTAAFVSNPWISEGYGFAQGFDRFHEEQGEFFARVGDLLDDARAWLSSRDTGTPYFLYLHFMDVHAPYTAPRGDFLALRGSPDVASDRVLKPKEMPDVRWMNIEVRPEWATDDMRREVGYWRARYASGVRTFDRKLGEFVQDLRSSGELDRAMFVFTSDHGEELFEHGNWSHGQNLFEHQLHVPLFVRKPGGRGGGVQVEEIVELVDVMPTLLSLAAIDPTEGMQGRDVTGLMNATAAVADSGIAFATATQYTPGLYSARTERYKLIYNIDNDGRWLFDLSNDRGEQRDVSGARSDVANGLKDRLLTHIRDSVAAGRLAPEAAEIPDDLRERLEALGYLN